MVSSPGPTDSPKDKNRRSRIGDLPNSIKNKLNPGSKKKASGEKKYPKVADLDVERQKMFKNMGLGGVDREREVLGGKTPTIEDELKKSKEDAKKVQRINEPTNVASSRKLSLHGRA